MANPIQRSISEPERIGLDWNAAWQGPDRGLITCWETGRKLAIQIPELAERCRAGELAAAQLERRHARSKRKTKPALFTTWPNGKVTLTCTKTGMVITYTGDISKLADQHSDTDNEEGDSNGRPTSGIPEQSLLP